MATKKAKCNGQLLVSYDGKEEAQRLYDWLDRNGYGNPQKLTADGYSFPVVVVDEWDRVYFGTNVTCMAASASCGIHAIKLEKFFELKAEQSRGEFFIDYTKGERTKRVGKSASKEEAIAQAKAYAEWRKGDGGIITVYQISHERGMPMRKIYEFIEV